MTKQELYILRRNKRITLKDLAIHLSCSISLISRYEREERNLSNELVIKYNDYIMKK